MRTKKKEILNSLYLSAYTAKNERNLIIDWRYHCVTHFKRSYYTQKHAAFEHYDVNRANLTQFFLSECRFQHG